MEFSNVLKKLRKQKNIRQETLADFLGISTQAVSKWECGLSCPDIELLPILAGYFETSVDYLLSGSEPLLPRESREGSDALTDGHPQEEPAVGETSDVGDWNDMPLSELLKYLPDNSMDDDTLYIIQCRGGRILTKDAYNPEVKIPLLAENGTDASVEIWGSASIEGDIGGNVNAGDGVACGNVDGHVNAGDSVACGNVGGHVNAGDNVACGNVGGNVNAGDNVTCGNVAGDVKADDGNVQCGRVNGDIDADGSVTCGDVKGNIRAGGDVRCTRLPF